MRSGVSRGSLTFTDVGAERVSRAWEFWMECRADFFCFYKVGASPYLPLQSCSSTSHTMSLKHNRARLCVSTVHADERRTPSLHATACHAADFLPLGEQGSLGGHWRHGGRAGTVYLINTNTAFFSFWSKQWAICVEWRDLEQLWVGERRERTALWARSGKSHCSTPLTCPGQWRSGRYLKK